MADRWDSLRSKFQGKNIDLDAEFEKFLNESLSDDSLASPRLKTNPLKGKSVNDKGSSLPWWAEEDEDEDKKQEATRKSWIKQKPNEDLPKISDVQESQPSITGVTEDSRHGDNMAISMSKDSLDEGTRKSLQQETLSPHIDDDITESFVYEEEEKDIPTYCDEIQTSIDSTSPIPPSRMKTPDMPPLGLDTLEEQEDKERFFQQDGADSQLDYENVLDDLTSTDWPYRDDKLQATGVEVGNSIFNISGNHQEERSEIMTNNNDNDEYSDDFEEVNKKNKDCNVEAGESLVVNTTKNVNDEVAKPSLLSKVSLMDSLDSTLDRNKPLPKQQPLPQQQPLPKQQQSEQQTLEESARRLRASDTGNLGNMYSGTTDTIAELQAALRQVQMDNTDRSGVDTGVEPEDNTQDNQLLVKKTPTGETQSRGFSLRPPVIGSNTSKDNELKPADSAAFTITSDSINSASIPVDCRGFSLQPSAQHSQPALAVDSRGIPLKSRVVTLSERADIEDSRGFDLKPVADLLTIIDQEVAEREKYIKEKDDDEEEDTPPPDSLRSIKEKARARKSVDTSKRSSGRKTPVQNTESPIRTRGSGKVTKKGPKKSKDQWQPCLSSPPSWSPTATTRKNKTTESKIPTLKSKPMKNRKVEDKAIVKSVESFANYLKHLVRPDEENSQSPPTPRWSDDEPIKSRSSVRITSTEDRLDRISREKRLQAEIENWQEAWKEERRRNDKLIADMAARERELSRKEENTRMAYEEQIHELKQEMFSLQARLKEEQENNDNRKRVASGGSLKGISEEDKKKLEKEIHEQEKLMQGYQQENERLYKELKQTQAQVKSTEGRMFAENQKLATDVANLKEKLDQKAGQPHYSALGSATLGADRINYLQDQLGSYKKREKKLDQEIDELRNVNTTLEQRIRNLERERHNAVERANQALGTSTQERSELKIRYQNDIERLNRKLKWYAENQEMLDRDIVKMKMKDQEIKELKDTLERLLVQQNKAATEKKERTNERTADARRIRDLERQVREMEEIIKRRYPNSLPALIFAAASAPGLAQPVADESPKKQSPSYVFLEQQVKKLEHHLEDKDEEASRVLRALEQKYNAMKLDYEERIKELEQSLERANEKPKREHPHTTAHALENEIAAVREDDGRRIRELENEVVVLQDALSQASMAHVKSKKKRKSDGKKIEGDTELLQRLQTLEKHLEEKEKDITELRETCLKLQQERETMLASPQRPSPNTPPRQAELERQNTALKQQLSDITLTMDQDRVRYQASLAEAERNARQSRDDAADQIENLKAQHQQEMNQIKGEFAVRLSTSVVTELKSKMASQEIIIQKLRDRVIMETRNSEELSAAKAREQALQQQLANLQNELRQAKESFTPEMRHFDALQSKINVMEQRFNQRESDLERIINNAQIKSRIEMDESDSQWKLIIKKKNQEIERFREELDAILEALRELKRQGVVIPIVGNRY